MFASETWLIILEENNVSTFLNLIGLWLLLLLFCFFLALYELISR